MLTRLNEVNLAALRLQRFGVPAQDARSLVAEVLGFSSWDHARERVTQGLAIYSDSWVCDAALRYQSAILRLRPGEHTSPVSGALGRASILDIFKIDPPSPDNDLDSLSQNELIRRIAATVAPCQLMPPEPIQHKTMGVARAKQSVIGDQVVRSQLVRLAHEGFSKFRIDRWWVTVEDSSGVIAALNGHSFMPIDSRPVPGEKALMAADTIGKELLCELLSVVGSLPRGQIVAPTATADYLYVIPRARGNRLTTTMFVHAAKELQCITPRFGTFLIDPYSILDSLQFPSGVTIPSKEVIRKYMDDHFLLPIAEGLLPLKVGMRMRAARIHLGDEQALHLIGSIAKGMKLSAIQIPTEAELVERRMDDNRGGRGF